MRRRLGLLSGCALLLGCTPDPAEVAALKSKVESLETEVAVLKYGTEPSEEQLAKLAERVSSLENSQPRLFAELTPASDGYSIARSELGPVLVSLGEMEVHGKGSRVRIMIGNITSAVLQNPELIIVYFGEGDNAERIGPYSLKHTHPGLVPPGAWTTASVLFPELKPDELGEIRVFVNASFVQLR